jgi:hypothetical protein
MDLGSQVAWVVHLGDELARIGVGVHGDHGPGDEVGHDDRVGHLGAGQRSGPMVVEVKRPEPDGADVQREAERGPDTGVDRRGREGRPANRGPFPELRSEDRAVEGVGIDSRALAERELQVLDDPGDGIGEPERCCVAVLIHQHDPGTTDGDQVDARAAEPQSRAVTMLVIGLQAGRELAEIGGVHRRGNRQPVSVVVRRAP